MRVILAETFGGLKVKLSPIDFAIRLHRLKGGRIKNSPEPIFLNRKKTNHRRRDVMWFLSARSY